MAIEYNTIPEECRAQIFFKDGGFVGDEWEAEIDATGEIMALEDKDGNRYTTPTDLSKAGIERITLINHHVIQVSECEFCEAPLVDCFDVQGRDFLDCSNGCNASEGYYTPK